MTTFDTIFSAASQLPLNERVDLIDALWATVPLSEPLSEAWQQEIDLRWQEIESKAVDTIPADEVLEKLRAKRTRSDEN